MRHLPLLFAASSRGIASKLRLMSNSSSKMPRTNILAESWSTVSNDYDKIFAPRLAPWTQNVLDALRDAVGKDKKTSSRALVLCCGPGQELLHIAKILGPSSKVLGSDLAPGMVDVARERIEAECNKDINEAYKGCITAEVGDAMDPPPGPYHVLFSAFGLQQLPDPVKAVQAWIERVQPGGTCVFVYWPPSPPKIPGDDNRSPFGLWMELLNKKLGKESKDEPPWDENIAAALVKAGGEIIRDEFIEHEMCWKDAEDMFEGMTRAGPWHAMRLRRGDEFVDDLGQELQSFYPPGEALCHQFTARMFVVRRGGGEREQKS